MFSSKETIGNDYLEHNLKAGLK